MEQGTLGLFPHDMRMRRVLRGRPDETTRFFLASYGRIPHDEFFNPGNLERLMAEAA